ncbi:MULTISPECIES: MerR family transcriptional regulator [Streptosporangium]|uniref:DNA-binding transcriptional MerR regulator n=1 Tax=Streptosporangium brasiliense TaxID=47480 RepID=A0ABT9QYY3_9ACTN|nr:MerR family transcriptional regulator [Streptosporangium brasiliense]MDP9861739.1 DNA-binding transcriptional MerR regulator [Streptosporangium brasiliense]
MEWTIGELAERASAALTPTAQLNGRVRDVPNERLIRWYSTIGLLDPPSARRGRVAMYGRRHLLQLIAVKRRQAEGRTIAEIQAELTGATDQVLESIARLPEPPAEPAVPRTARPRFWAEPPTPAAPPPAAAAAPPPAAAAPSSPPPRPAAPPARAAAAGARPPAASAPSTPPTPTAAPFTPTVPTAPTAAVVHGVRLAAGVTLLLDGGGRAPSPNDLAEIGAASEALLSILREHDLAPPEGKKLP